MRRVLHAVWANLAVVALLLASVASVYFYEQNGDRIRDVQRARFDSIVLSCRQQNDRHDRTIAKLDELIGKMPAGPERKRARERRASTVVILDTLVPKFNCVARARQLSDPKGTQP